MSTLVQPPSAESARKKLDAQEARLKASSELLINLGKVAGLHPERFPGEAFRRAIESACENFGIECELYSDLTEELNAICDLSE